MTIQSAFSFASVQFSALLRSGFDTTQPVPGPVTDEPDTSVSKDSSSLADGEPAGKNPPTAFSDPGSAATALAELSSATLDRVQQQNLVQFQRASVSYTTRGSYQTEQGDLSFSQSFQLSVESFGYNIQYANPAGDLAHKAESNPAPVLPQAALIKPDSAQESVQGSVQESVQESVQGAVQASDQPSIETPIQTSVQTRHPESASSQAQSRRPESVPQSPSVSAQSGSTISASQGQGKIEEDSDHDSDHDERTASVNRLSSEDFQRLLVQHRESSVARSFSLELFTNEGDRVTLDFNRLDLLSRSRLGGTTQEGDRVKFTQLERSSERNLAVSIQGDISDEEQSAIDDLLEGIFKVADKFFRGNLRSAVERLGNLEFDSGQLSNFSLDMSLEKRQQVNRAFLGQGGEVERFVSRDKGMAQMLNVLMDDQRQLLDAARTRFDEKSSARLVKEVFLPLVLENRADQPSQAVPAVQSGPIQTS